MRARGRRRQRRAVVDLRFSGDDRQVARGLAVGDRAGLQDEPALDAMRVSQLEDETGLADSGLPDHRGDLALPRPGSLERAPDLLDLQLAPDEPRETARRGGL